MTHEVIPDVAGLPRNIEYQLTEYGGHVGFVGGTLKTAHVAGTSHSGLAPLSGHPYVIIPRQELATDTLNSLIESFVLREGTDYGEHERSLEQKVEDVRRQLKTAKWCWCGRNCTRASTSCRAASSAPGRKKFSGARFYD